MKRNGIDTRRYDIKQLTVEFTLPKPGTTYTMHPGQVVPQLNISTEPLGRCTIELLARGKDRNEITRNISEVMGMLSKPAILELDGYKGKYYGILVASKETKMQVPQRFRLHLEFDGYLMDTPVTIKFPPGSTCGTCHRVGSRSMPCCLILDPERDIDSISIQGVGKLPIIVENLTAGHKVTIDGTTGLITQDGASKAPDVTMWTLPAMISEEMTLTWDSPDVSVSVIYTPAWL